MNTLCSKCYGIEKEAENTLTVCILYADQKSVSVMFNFFSQTHKSGMALLPEHMEREGSSRKARMCLIFFLRLGMIKKFLSCVATGGGKPITPM